VSVGVVNLNAAPAVFSLFFSINTDSKFMIILIGTLGGILFIGLILLIIVIMRKALSE
jgi:hypothetical protein